MLKPTFIDGMPVRSIWLRLVLGDPLLPAARQLTQFVQLGVVARANHPAVRRPDPGGIVDQGPLDVARGPPGRGRSVLPMCSATRKNGRPVWPSASGAAPACGRCEPRSRGVARRVATRRASRCRSYVVVELPFAHVTAQLCVADKLFDRVQPAVDRLGIGQRTRQPVGQQPGPHRGDRLVDHVPAASPRVRPRASVRVSLQDCGGSLRRFQHGRCRARYGESRAM